MQGDFENRMIIDGACNFSKVPPEVKEKLNGAGYCEIQTGIFVPEEDAYDYALERIFQDEDLKQEFVEWFYSGNWIKED